MRRMIGFLVTAEHAYTIGEFLDAWGSAWRGRIAIVPYAEALAPGGRALAACSTWIFSDLERLGPADAEAAARLWHRFATDGARLLNHPTRSMRRYELLRTLHAAGRNRFAVYRADECRRPGWYPVFLRAEHEHGGNHTPLLPDAAALDAALAGLLAGGTYRCGELIVEFCDTSDAQGLFRKYSAFCVGGRILPRHVFFSYEWMVKNADRTEGALLAEELRYLEKNPHAGVLGELFALARIDYGRIDYALADDGLQVWEINSNPMILSVAHVAEVTRRPVHQAFATAFDAALAALA